MYRILIVEDDKIIAERISMHLEKYGYHPIVTDRFEAIDQVFEQVMPHVVLLDVNLPRFDGYYWCKKIRKMSSCPILFISARTGELDQVMAIECGADDFITKPFYYDVVVAKIKSQIRRVYGELSNGSADTERKVHFYGLTFFPERPELHYGQQSVSLMKKEADLLDLLISKYPRTVKREKIFERMWDDKEFISENTLNVNVARLRKKFAQLGIENAIETVKGLGYRLHVSWNEVDAE
jgi:Response regulators consisting of a CheY-like receiver domain and a winged-helix DNA-binding domain